MIFVQDNTPCRFNFLELPVPLFQSAGLNPKDSHQVLLMLELSFELCQMSDDVYLTSFDRCL